MRSAPPQSTPFAVELVVRGVRRLVRRVGITRRGKYPGVVGRDGREGTEDSRCGGARPDQPEVVAVHDDRVERSLEVARLRNVQRSGVEATVAAHLDRAGRHVDTDDVVSPFLQVAADATRATADIEDPSCRTAHRRALVLAPLVVLREVEVRAGRDPDPTVVALDDLDGVLAGVVVPYDGAVGVLVVVQHHTDVASPPA